MTDKNPGFFERANQWIRNSITLRLVTIGILILLMLIPVSMITDLIREREWRQEEAIREVSQLWGEAQQISGPVISVPYVAYSKVYDDQNNLKLVSTREYAHFLPSRLKITGNVEPEKRYRGIFEVVVYKSNLLVEGVFNQPDMSAWKIPSEQILWDEAFLSIGLSDLRGLKENVTMQLNGEPFTFQSGVESADFIARGISTRIKLDGDSSGKIAFSTMLQLNGSNALTFIPAGEVTEVDITSPWASPSFGGAFLPAEREINKDGFTASWKVLHLNRAYPQSFLGQQQGVYESAFGVDLIVPVDEYQKSMRSAKYAVLFITLTFMMFFFAQILRGVRIHPIQYLLVGFALCIFYTLLIALSEHIAFAWSYLIASIAIILLITFYVKSIFKNRRVTGIIAVILAILYLFIFSIIQMEDYALLMGSIGLFIVLTIAMVLSARINWYAIGQKQE